MGDGGRQDLEQAYRATTYEVELPWETVAVRIDGRYPQVDAFVQSTGTLSWAVITAWNPRSQVCATSRNAQRQLELARKLDARGLPVRGAAGVPDRKGWTAEPSLFVAGLARREALALAAEFEQNAIVFGDVGGTAELLWTVLDGETDSPAAAH